MNQSLKIFLSLVFVFNCLSNLIYAEEVNLLLDDELGKVKSAHLITLDILSPKGFNSKKVVSLEFLVNHSANSSSITDIATVLVDEHGSILDTKVHDLAAAKLGSLNAMEWPFLGGTQVPLVKLRLDEKFSARNGGILFISYLAGRIHDSLVVDQLVYKNYALNLQKDINDQWFVLDHATSQEIFALSMYRVVDPRFEFPFRKNTEQKIEDLFQLGPLLRSKEDPDADRVSSKEQDLVTINSDIPDKNNNILAFKMGIIQSVADQENSSEKITKLYLKSFKGNVEQDDVSEWRISELNSGIVLYKSEYKSKTYDVITVKAINFDPERGGELTISYLSNAMTGSQGHMKVLVLKEGGVWVLKSIDKSKSIHTLFCKSKKFLGFTVGVEQISVKN